MTYNNSVLVGNWSEERLKNEYEFKVFLRRRDRKELLLQKSRNLFSNLLKERPLMISGKFVLYGFNVQVVASDMPAKAATPGEKQKYGLALSSLVTDRQVDFMQNINDGCLMTLSSITTPCCRNTFVILNTHDESLRGTKMNYGDEFLLRSENYGDPGLGRTANRVSTKSTTLWPEVEHAETVPLCTIGSQGSCRNTPAPPLYVRYTPEGVPGPADRMPIRLSSIKDSNCRWTTIPQLPRDRLEGLGSAVQTNTRLILKNCVADMSLCVMNQCWMTTFFGPECGVTCRNYIDIHKRHTAENIFMLVSDIATKSK